jgi:hypothetical protein
MSEMLCSFRKFHVEVTSHCELNISHKQKFQVVRFEVFTVVTMKNAVFYDVTPCGCLRTDVSEELRASIIRVKRIGELGTMLVVTSNRRTLRRNGSYKSHTA